MPGKRRGPARGGASPRAARHPRPLPGGGALLLLIFLISGASGLIFQIVWSRSLTLVFGSTTQGVATVLAVFMGGLALGSWLASRVGDRVRSPLRAYGLLELGIALLALGVLLLIPALDGIYLALYGWVRLSLPGLTLLRFILAALFLLPATTLMGATLPVLSAYFERRNAVAGQGASILYAVNTLGAVAGTAGAGFWLIPAAGLTGSSLVAAGGNVTAALAALVLSALAERGGREIRIPLSGQEPSSGPASPGGDPLPGRARLAVTVAIGASGAGALVLEVIWTRTLSLVLGSSTHAFSIMLTTFLVGLALGSAAAGKLLGRLRRPVEAFAAVEIGVALSVLAGVFLFPELPYAFIELFRATREAPGLFQAGRFALSASVMFLPTLLLGATFPLAVRCRRLGQREAARPVGMLYAVNTVGAIVGSLAAGFLLIPWLGLRMTMITGAGVNLLVGALLLAAAPGRGAALRWGPALAAAAFLPFMAVVSPRWNPMLMTSGVFQYAPQYARRCPTRADFLGYHDAHEQLFYRDGLTTTVTVVRRPPDVHGERTLALTLGGKVDASTAGDMETQILAGQYPMLFARHPRRALVIGWGSGITVGSVLTHPELESLKAVEIEKAVMEGARFFDEYTWNAREDPRLEVEINDARHALLVDRSRYDVIVSEPSNPWLPGPARLFTREFFEMVRDRLAPGGIFCQWIQLYGMDTDSYRTLLRTLTSVFTDVIVFKGSGGDTQVISSAEPLRLDLAQVAGRMEIPSVSRDLARIGVEDLGSLLARFRLGGDAVREMAGSGPLNTDDNAYVEFAASRAFYNVTEVSNDRLLAEAPVSPLPFLDLSGLDGHRARLLPVEIAGRWISQGMTRKARALLAEAGDPARLPPRIGAEVSAAWGELLLVEGDPAAAEASWREALRLHPVARAWRGLGRMRAASEQWGPALAAWEHLLELHPRDPEGLRGAVAALTALGREDEAMGPLERLVEMESDPARRRQLLERMERLRGASTAGP